MKHDLLLMKRRRLSSVDAGLLARRGSVSVLSIFMFLAVLACGAMAFNLGYLANSKAQMQNASDAASKAAAWKIVDTYDYDNSKELATEQAEFLVLSTMDAAGVPNTFYPATDVKYGQFEWNKDRRAYDIRWGVNPPNLVRVDLSRIVPRGNAFDVILSTILGRDKVDLMTNASAALMPATGFYLPPGSPKPLGLLPITVDIDTWIDMETHPGNYDDKYTIDPRTGAISSGPDGIPELKIFPLGEDKTLPPGNRGTLSLGANNNSTQKLSRQIREGLSPEDLAAMSYRLDVSQGPIYIQGDPGISAAIEDDLEAIIGKNRAIPLFTEVVRPGSNATYTIVKFVGVKVLYSNLRGARKYKEVIIQPATFALEEAETNTKMPFSNFGTVFSKPMFVNTD